MATKDLIPINNGGFIKTFQYFNGDIVVQYLDSDENVNNWQIISGNDFVSMLNWYCYQKDNGNKELMFE